jgi:trehalose 6-phosphate synthase/phosphatase
MTGITEVIKKFRRASRRLILLDYDGTLVNFAPTPEEAVPTRRVLDILGKLSARGNTRVVIITGRNRAGIETMIGHLSLDIVAEHGAVRRLNNEWKNTVSAMSSWKNKILGILEEFVSGVPGSFIEKKEFALTWHYRQCDEKAGTEAAAALISQLTPLVKEYQLKLIDGNKVIEIIAGNYDKGKAALLLAQTEPYDFILAIGDDRTDEDMFAALRKLPSCFTIKVGKGETAAEHQLVNVQEVLLFLEQI